MVPEISVIVPTYNAGSYFRGMLASIDSQTLSKDKYETVIVDDFSGDGSFGVAKDWAHGKSNVTVLRNLENSGIAVSRNVAIGASRGRYIALLDSDDIFVPSALGKSLDFFSKNPDVKYSYSVHDRMDEGGKFICHRPSQEFSMKDLFHYNFVGHLKCFERDLHDRIGGFSSDSYAEDWDHVIKAAIMMEGSGIKRNNEVLYKYRWHFSNTSNSKVDQIRKSISGFLSGHLKSIGVDAGSVRHSHFMDEGYNYYDWSVEE